ncbi:catalase-related domain-containing protein, partial [Bacillus inaquosorum]
NNYYSQAKLFWNSMSPVEKQHIISAFCFEVGKVKSKDVQRQVVDVFSNVDAGLAEEIAKGVGVAPPAKRKASKEILTSPALSQARTVKTASTRKVAVLAGNGFHEKELQTVLDAL